MPAGPTARPGPGQFFGTVRGWGVGRGEDRWFAGVCGGVATRLGLDPLVVRGVLIALTAVGGLGLLAYGLGWALLPDTRPMERSGRIEAEAALRGDVSGSLLAAAALVLLDLAWGRGILGLGWGGWEGPGWGFLVTGLIGGVGWWLLRDRLPSRTTGRDPADDGVPAPGPLATTVVEESSVRTEPSVPPPIDLSKPVAPQPTSPGIPFAGHGSSTERSRAARVRPEARRSRPGSPLSSAAVLGTALLGVGVLVVLDRLGDLPGDLVTSAATLVLVLFGLGALVAGLRGRSSALVGWGVPVAFVAIATAVLPAAGNWTWQVQGRWSPTAASVATEPAVSTAAGQLLVDPSGLPGAGAPAVATMAAGRLVVTTPTATTVLVQADVLAGGLTWVRSPDVVAVTDLPAGGTENGVQLSQVFAMGPAAEQVAAATGIRGDDPADWDVPAGTGVLQARVWAGQLVLGEAAA